MTSIHLEFVINAGAGRVWDVIGDWGDGPLKMAPGYVVSSQADGNVRVVEFANGAFARERLVARDDRERRIVYSVVGDTLRPEHDNAVMQVFADGPGRCRLVWSRDVLPDDIGVQLRAAMAEAGAVIQQAFAAG